MAEQTIRVDGLKELLKATGGYKTDLAKEVRKELSVAAKVVSTDARARMSGIDSRSAMGLVPFARASGAAGVKQRRKKVRPFPGRADFGALQMRKALLPALWGKRAETLKAMETMLDKLGGKHGF